jgi:hypothetical protein
MENKEDGGYSLGQAFVWVIKKAIFIFIFAMALYTWCNSPFCK